MATSIVHVGVSSSQLFCPTIQLSNQVGANTKVCTPPNRLVVCQHDTTAADVSRRCFVAAAASATVLGVFTQTKAEAAGRRKPASEEEKKVEEEDKRLSAYDQKLLATTRRKEAMKAAVEAQKAKSIANNS